MRTTPAVFLSAVFVGLMALPAGAAGQSLLVLNKGDLSLAIVDADTLRVTGRVSTGPDPHEVVASGDGSRAWVSNYTRGNGAANTITVIDLAARAQTAPIDLGDIARPHGLDYSGDRLYFTAEGSRVAGRIDPATGRVEWTVNTGQDGTHMILVAPDRARLFTTNLGSGSVSILDRSGSGDRAADWRVTTVPVGRGAEGFDLSPDGRELWTANAADATVSIVNVASRTVAETIPVRFARANRLKFTPDGAFVLISDLGGRELVVLDAATRKEVKRIDVGGRAAGLLVEPSGRRAFLSVGSRNAVAVIDLKTLAVTDWISTGPNPDGLAWVP